MMGGQGDAADQFRRVRRDRRECAGGRRPALRPASRSRTISRSPACPCCRPSAIRRSYRRDRCIGGATIAREGTHCRRDPHRRRRLRHHPRGRNPAAPGCAVSGSSGGSAAAVVAAGLADVALGTDTGGSVAFGTAYTGLIGFKPTRGQIATDGVWPLSPRLDLHIGIIGRDLDIVAQTAECLLTPSPACSACVATPVAAARSQVAGRMRPSRRDGIR